MFTKWVVIRINFLFVCLQLNASTTSFGLLTINALVHQTIYSEDEGALFRITIVLMRNSETLDNSIQPNP